MPQGLFALLRDVALKLHDVRDLQVRENLNRRAPGRTRIAHLESAAHLEKRRDFFGQVALDLFVRV